MATAGEFYNLEQLVKSKVFRLRASKKSDELRELLKHTLEVMAAGQSGHPPSHAYMNVLEMYVEECREAGVGAGESRGDVGSEFLRLTEFIRSFKPSKQKKSLLAAINKAFFENKSQLIIRQLLEDAREERDFKLAQQCLLHLSFDGAYFREVLADWATETDASEADLLATRFILAWRNKENRTAARGGGAPHLRGLAGVDFFGGVAAGQGVVLRLRGDSHAFGGELRADFEDV